MKMVRQLVIISCCAIALSACGGGGSGSATTPPAPDAPFAFTSASVADNAVNVPRDGGVTLNFSNPLNPASLTAQSVTLTGPLGNVLPLDLAVSGSSVTLGGNGLPGNTKYKLDLSTAIANAEGVTLPSGYSKTFTTAPQAWQKSASELGSQPNFTGNTRPWVAADSAGNVTVVWQKDERLVATSFYAARLDAKTGTWGAAQLVYRSGPDDGVGGVRLTAGLKGELYLTWAHYAVGAGASSVGRMSRYTPASGWSAPIDLQISPPPFTGASGFLAAGPDGKLMMLGLVNGRVYANTYDPVAGVWGTPERLDITESSEFYSLGAALAGDGKGNFIAAWEQDFSTTGRNPVVARYSNGKWSKPQKLNGDVFGGSPVVLSLSVNAAGQASLVWTRETIATGGGVMASYYSPVSDSWAEPTTVSVGNAYQGIGVIDAAGNITVSWAGAGMFARRFSIAGNSWSAAQQVSLSAVSGDGAVMAVDSAGNVTMIFAEDQLEASQYLAGDGQWHLASIGGAADGSFVFTNPPVLTIDSGGVITVSWLAMREVGGQQTTVVAANRFK
jgi:hypothetical protein